MGLSGKGRVTLRRETEDHGQAGFPRSSRPAGYRLLCLSCGSFWKSPDAADPTTMPYIYTKGPQSPCEGEIRLTNQLIQPRHDKFFFPLSQTLG